jgi:hypothetical protein
MKSVDEIIAEMTPEQRRESRIYLGNALEIVHGIVGEMPFSSLFTLTCAVVDELEGKQP